MGRVPFTFCRRCHVGAAEPRYFLRDADRLPFGTYYYSISLVSPLRLTHVDVWIAASVHAWLGGKAASCLHLDDHLLT